MLLNHFGRTATSSPFPQLTEREHGLALLAAGRDNTAVARLGVSSKTGAQPRLQHHHQAARGRPVRSDHPGPGRRHGWSRRLQLEASLSLVTRPVAIYR